ncbi:MAG: hypothetical protein ACYCX2_12140 [Christensenellales bacterium]
MKTEQSRQVQTGRQQETADIRVSRRLPGKLEKNQRDKKERQSVYALPFAFFFSSVHAQFPLYEELMLHYSSL